MPLTGYDIECLEKVKTIIDSDISRHFITADLAESAGLGETRLKALFKSHFKSGVFEYLRKQRMTRATEMLLNTNKNIMSIGKANGFKHYTNFITAFKKYYGETPARWRREQR